jgi:hypothetical protein
VTGRNVVDVHSKSDVREFLASRQARITPEQAGLPYDKGCPTSSDDHRPGRPGAVQPKQPMSGRLPADLHASGRHDSERIGKLSEFFTLGGDLRVRRLGFGAMQITGPGI